MVRTGSRERAPAEGAPRPAGSRGRGRAAREALLTELVHRTRPAAGAPDGALVLLHGRGANEYDLEPLMDELDPDRRLVGFLPRGPLTLPPGGAHWYVVRRVGFPDPETWGASFAALSAWVDAVTAEAGVPPERLVVGGFSQGSVMAYSLALHRDRPRPAAVLAFSGFVPVVDGFEADLVSRAALPVSIAHGTHDQIITVDFGRRARDLLAEGGLEVEYVEEPLPHAIGPAGLAQARDVLARALA